MTMTKKRTEFGAVQSSTLLDFFSGASATPKEKRKAGATPGPSSRKVKPKVASSTGKRTALAQEVIVISDDDGEYSSPSKGTKRAKTEKVESQDDSDIELVENLAENAPTHPSAPATHPNLDVKTEVIEDVDMKTDRPAPRSPSVTLVDDTTSPTTVSEWGVPTLLMEPSEEICAGSSENLEQLELSKCSGQPVVTLRPQDCTPAPTETKNDVIDLDDDEVWEMGDDEVVYAPADDGVTPTGEQDPLPQPTVEESTAGKLQTCPVCEKALGSMSNEDSISHVDGCIKSLGGISPDISDVSQPPPSCTSTGFKRPLSPIPPPQPSASSSPCKQAKDSNAFSFLMSSFKENEAWKEASAAEDPTFRPTKANGGRRKAPFYKVLQGMPIAVDAFRYGTIPGVTAYFLTHAHSDHYTNLSSNWKSGPIYCSAGTANLIKHMLGVDPKWVHPLPMDTPVLIPNSGGVHVTLIEANHCPGSSLFLFEGKQTIDAGDSAYKSSHIGSSRVFCYLHCGDFRASPQHILHPTVKGKKIDTVYLDTTYLDPKYCFPPQPLVITACAELARMLVADEPIQSHAAGPQATMNAFFSSAASSAPKGQSKSKQKKLVVVGTYSIGKERIVKAIARALNTKVYCDARKTAILRCQDDPELHALLTNKPLEARVHLVPLGVVSSDKLKDYVARWKGHFTHAIAFRPTGWTFTPPSGTDTLPAIASVISRSQQRSFTHADLKPMRNSSAALQLYGVPYSEHSSFFELTCFALSLDWGRIIATVNVGNENARRKMNKWVEKWDAERKRLGGEIVPHRQPDYW